LIQSDVPYFSWSLKLSNAGEAAGKRGETRGDEKIGLMR
jgi:hypothetical protein